MPLRPQGLIDDQCIDLIEAADASKRSAVKLGVVGDKEHLIRTFDG